MKYVSLELTDLEWEVINKALEAPIREHLITTIRAVGRTETDEEITAAWDSVIEKWSATW